MWKVKTCVWYFYRRYSGEDSKSTGRFIIMMEEFHYIYTVISNIIFKSNWAFIRLIHTVIDA